MEVLSIHSQVRELESYDKLGITTSSAFVQESLRADVNRTYAYLNSKFESGDTDYLGRAKPFFNIVLAARNIWFRATDIDRKNILIRATSQKTVIPAFLATLKLQEWMKKQKFGQFLNDWGLSLATHGSTVTKFIEKQGELSCQVIDWNNLLCDAVDFENNIKVEKLWFTPAQLQKNKNFDQELVQKLIDNPTTRKTMEGQQKDTKSNYILVYEVHGELPLSLLTDNEDDDETYVQQMHVISFTEKKDKGFDDYTLYSGKESKDPYMITHLMKKDGITYSGGAVKNLFEAQWMVNHTQKQIKDQLDLASKIIYQTSDGTFVGQNVLTNIENGDILNHKVNEPLTRLAGSPDTVAMQNFKTDWQAVANQINGISESMMGENPPAGTAWRLEQAKLQESHTLFKVMGQNKGFAIIEMLREYILPSFKKTLNNNDEIAGVLEAHQIKQIDSMYVPNQAIRMVNDKKKQTILSGQIYDPALEAQHMADATAQIQSGLTGNQRFISPDEVDWRTEFAELDWDNLDIEVTGESFDTQGALATMTSVLQTLAQNPNAMQDQNFKTVFSKILQLSGGISPLELTTPAAQPAQAVMPAMA